MIVNGGASSEHLRAVKGVAAVRLAVADRC